MQNNQLFSKEALDKLRSPERLDVMLSITTPIGWMLMITIGCFLFAILLWSIFGALAVKADGMGLIMDSAGIVNVTHTSGGKIEHLYVSPGQKVTYGDLLAVIEQPDLEADMNLAKYNVENADSGRDVKQHVSEFNNREFSFENSKNIYSWFDGIVDEIPFREGSFLQAGAPLCSIRLTEGSDDLTGVLYIPVEYGKRVEPGMTVQLVPNGVDASESGSLIGIVRSVSQYPVTEIAVQNRLGNVQLANWIFQKQKSALTEVYFELVKDKKSKSGYLWTSKIGEHKPVTPGSFCIGSVVIDRKPPIDRVFYKISQWLRSR